MTPIRVLLVEDQPEEREIYTRFMLDAERLVPDEMEIVGCARLGDAGVMIEARRNSDAPFDVVMLDLGLPDSSRDKTMGRIPELKEAWRILIFVITGSEEIECRDHCLAMGADEFTTKKKIISACGCVLERIYNLCTKERLLGHAYNK
jgi:CheY-like chemotaxis protein